MKMPLLTNDKTIRVAFCDILKKDLDKYKKLTGCSAEIFEELGVRHGTARIDIATINGIMHGYEIKSDRDTLERLPEQVKEFSAVFDKITIVLGKRHLYNATNNIPDWWGITIAKISIDNKILFQMIREPENNPNQHGISVARLLWRNEALKILENRNLAKGVRSKPREFIYERLANKLSIDELKEQVIAFILAREGWRSGARLMLNGD